MAYPQTAFKQMGKSDLSSEKPPVQPFTLQTESEEIEEWIPIQDGSLSLHFKDNDQKVVKLYPSAMSVISFYNEVLTLWRGAFSGSKLDYTSLEQRYLQTIKTIESYINNINPDCETKLSDS